MMHGGDIYSNDIKVDFSVNVNPMGVPELFDGIFNDFDSYFALYPEYESKELRTKLAELYDLNTENVLCGNGASEIFMAIAHAIRPKTALIVAPSFSGYVWAFDAVDAKLTYYVTKAEDNFSVKDDIVDIIENNTDIDMLVFANPSNPVGNYIDNVLLDKLLAKCEEKEIVVLIDECFMELSDYSQNTSTDKIKSFDNLLIVRAFTKTFAIPALRLGYILGSDLELMKKIRRQLPEWNVSLPAQRAGETVFSLKGYLDASREMIIKERLYLKNELEAMGIKVFPSSANFILIKTDIPLYSKLLEKGFLIRDCSDFHGLNKGYYRIAVKTHEENEILINTIKEIIR